MNRLLVIDDDVDILAALETMLSMEGFDVRISTRPDVIDKIDVKKKPDVIIMDVLLSGSDGRMVCRRLKSQDATKDIPVFMISAHPDVKKSVLKAGANDFMAKPFDVYKLVGKIRTLLN